MTSCSYPGVITNIKFYSSNGNPVQTCPALQSITFDNYKDTNNPNNDKRCCVYNETLNNSDEIPYKYACCTLHFPNKYSLKAVCDPSKVVKELVIDTVEKEEESKDENKDFTCETDMCRITTGQIVVIVIIIIISIMIITFFLCMIWNPRSK